MASLSLFVVVCMCFFSAVLAQKKSHESYSFLGPIYPSSLSSHSFSSTPTLSVTPDFISSRNATIELSWVGVINATKDDWIGIYSPGGRNEEEEEEEEEEIDYVNDVLDWFYVSDVLDVKEWKKGRGAVSLSLLNMRETYRFRYFTPSSASSSLRNSVEVWALVMSSPLIQVSDIPLQVHLSLSSHPSEMRVLWVTKHFQSTSRVLFSTSPFSSPFSSLLSPFSTSTFLATSSSPSQTYEANDMCGSPANQTSQIYFRHPGYINDVLLTGLLTSTKYYYMISVNDSSFYTAGVYEFISAPEVGAEQSVSFAVYGDMGEGAWLIPEAKYTAQNIDDLVNQGRVQLVNHIGDISYALGQGFVWEYFFNLIMSTASRVPYMVDVGNHEYDHTSGAGEDPSHMGLGFHPSWGNYGDDSAGECGVPFNNRFHMPDNGFGNWWYSFDFGSVHHIHISTEHNYTTDSPQYNWLAHDLASVNRSRTPWVVLNGHRPMYTSEDYQSDYNVSLYIQDYLEELTHKFGVDIAFWGHYHSYERTCQVYKQECTTGQDETPGTVHIIVGAAGADLDQASWMNKTWSLNHLDDFGYGLVDVTYDASTSSSSLQFGFYFNSNQTRFDSVTLKKSV